MNRGERKKFTQPKSYKKAITIPLVIICIFFILWVAGLFLGSFSVKKILGDFSFKGLSRSIGIEPQKDKQGNINVLLVGIGGAKHAGGSLADSIIVASFDVKNSSLSMLSIPRDLYVSERGKQSRINTVFSRGYIRGNKSLLSGVNLLRSKVEEIVGVEIPYYCVIDFHGFEKFIDIIGGIKIDIPETIYDLKYPASEKGAYELFYIQAGMQREIDGKTALKYARSRHSTSDFSRSIRQQQILNGIKEKFLQKGVSISQIKKYYSLYKDMVETNISLQEVLGGLKYIDSNVKISNFGLTTHCSYSNFKAVDPGCFLYFPKRESFGGAAVILPQGATASHVSFYKYIHNFVDIIFHDQRFLIEKHKIKISNGIDHDFAKKYKKSSSGWAGKVAVKLKKYGFIVEGIENAKDNREKTTIIIPSTGGDMMYYGTIDKLKRFVPIENIEISISTGKNYLELILGNNFITQVVKSGFDLNKL